MTTPTAPALQLRKIERETLTVRVIGTAPLIVHRFDEKAKQTMLDAMQGKKKSKTMRDPQADYERSLYRLPNNSYGFPCTAFKAATVDAARYFQGVKMTELRQALLFEGVGPDKLVRIDGEPKMREVVALNPVMREVARREMERRWKEFRRAYADQEAFWQIILADAPDRAA
jgi:hypothetical protein